MKLSNWLLLLTVCGGFGVLFWQDARFHEQRFTEATKLKRRLDFAERTIRDMEALTKGQARRLDWLEKECSALDAEIALPLMNTPDGGSKVTEYLLRKKAVHAR